MCELMGMCFNTNVRVNFSLRGLINHSPNNRDGWGLASYPDGGYAASVLKEPIYAASSPMAEFFKSYKLSSSIYISHIRKATSAVNYGNTHPFVRQFNGREYAFAHNGYLNNYKTKLQVGRWKPIGSTDSEYAFCHLMNVIENKISSLNEESFGLIELTLRNINEYGTFNCIFSDGEYLFCYRDKRGYKGLNYVKREYPFEKIKLEDSDFEIDLKQEKGMDELGYIFATYPLTNEEWQEVETGKMMVTRLGDLIYPLENKVTDEQLLSVLRFIRTQPHRVSIFDLCNQVGIKIVNVKPLIEKLKSKDFIKQHSRDQEGPYDPGATYYTVPEKGETIDRILLEDGRESALEFNIKDSMQADLDDKMLFCTKCFTVYKKGKAFCRTCLSTLEAIDTTILDVIILLNSKGYHTTACCGGHVNEGVGETYILFSNKLDEKFVPDGFTLKVSKEGTTVVRCLPFRFQNKKIKLETSMMESLIKENIRSLRKWAQEVPALQV